MGLFITVMTALSQKWYFCDRGCITVMKRLSQKYHLNDRAVITVMKSAKINRDPKKFFLVPLGHLRKLIPPMALGLVATGRLQPF